MTLISMSSRRGLLAGAAVLALSAGTLQAQEVTVWFWDTNFNGAAMQAAADRYAAINPDVTITLVDLAKVDLEQNLQTQLASGVTEGLPDIVLVDDLRAQIYLQSFPGAFAPLNDHIDYSQFAAYKIGVATVDGLTYSLPFDSGVAGFFYRSDILAEAGYGAADLEDITWNRFLEIAKDVTAKTGHQMFSHNVDNPSPIRMMLQSAGSWYFTPEGELDLVGNPVFRETLETWGEILRATEIWKPTSGWSDYTGAFTSGEVASVPFTGGLDHRHDQIGYRSGGSLGRSPGAPAGRRRIGERHQLWWIKLVCAGQFARTRRRHRLSGQGLGQRCRLLSGHPCRARRVCDLSPGARRRGLFLVGRLLWRTASMAELFGLGRRDSPRQLWHLCQRG